MTFNKDILYALIASALGVVITVYSYSLINLIADPYLLPYVYSNPMNEAVSSVDRFLTRMNIIDGVAVLIGVIFLALAICFASRYISHTVSKTRRMAAIVFATLIGVYGVSVMISNLL